MFAAALMDTVCVIDDWNGLEIHEWGVLTVADEYMVDAIPGETDGPLLIDVPNLDDRAPVVYFYGAEFTDGEFSVSLPSGVFTASYPQPDAISPDGSTITWRIRSASNLGIEEIPPQSLPEQLSTTAWSMNEWRNGQANVLEFENGSMDRFLFYECSIPLTSSFYPFTDTGHLDESFDGQVIELSYSAVTTSVPEMTVFSYGDSDQELSEPEPYDFDRVLSTLCTWSAGEMKSEEINDLWVTWQDHALDLIDDGGTLLIFRIPAESVERISTISFSAEGWDLLTIRRFYLGMAVVD